MGSFFGKGSDGIDLPIGIEPEVSKCRICGKEFRETFVDRTIDGDKMEEGGMLDGSDLLAVHEMQEHGIFGDDDVKGNISAKKGFMGTVSHKTMFTVGEQKRKEFVSVKPKKDDFSMFGNPKKKGKKSNNIFDVGF